MDQLFVSRSEDLFESHFFFLDQLFVYRSEDHFESHLFLDRFFVYRSEDHFESHFFLDQLFVYRSEDHFESHFFLDRFFAYRSEDHFESHIFFAFFGFTPSCFCSALMPLGLRATSGCSASTGPGSSRASLSCQGAHEASRVPFGVPFGDRGPPPSPKKKAQPGGCSEFRSGCL